MTEVLFDIIGEHQMADWIAELMQVDQRGAGGADDFVFGDVEAETGQFFVQRSGGQGAGVGDEAAKVTTMFDLGDGFDGAIDYLRADIQDSVEIEKNAA